MRGARQRSDRDFVEALSKRSLLLTPSEKNWMESGRLLTRMSVERRFPPEKLRDLHFDVLIALTASSHGATVVTSNRAVFEMIRRYKRFALEIW